MLQYPIQRVRAAPPLHQQKGARPADIPRMDAWLAAYAQIAAKATRNTIGVQVMTLKGRHLLQKVEPFTEGMVTKSNRYRTKTIPAAGALPLAEDIGEQLTLD